MDKRDRAGDGWTEPEVTSVSVTEGRPHVQVVMFNQNQEGRGPNRLGADYLWWWFDSSSGECFGMLIQAKRLTIAGTQWHVDIRHRDGDQLRSLLHTARDLQVPAVYSIYTGGLVYRTTLPCQHHVDGNPRSISRAAPATPGTTPGTGVPTGRPCERCHRMAISIITAYQLNSVWYSPDQTGDTVLRDSIPLEDLVDPAVPTAPVPDINASRITDLRLLAFLRDPQQGAKAVAQRIFRLVATRRNGQFSAPTMEERVRLTGALVFEDVPADEGHFPGPYYPHVLQGLRTSPPDYVAELVDRTDTSSPPQSRPRPAELDGSNVAGIVLVTL